MPIRQNELMRRAFLLPLFAALLAVGCRPGEEKIQWAVRQKTYSSVASLSPSTTEITASVAYNVRLVGRTAACDFPPSVKTVPIVAQVKPDYEKLKATSAGLVIYDPTLYGDADIAQIKALGMDTFAFESNTVEGFEKELLKYGSMVGAEMETSTYVDKIAAEKKEPISPLPKVAIILPGKGGEHMIAGKSNFHADVVRLSGGEAVGPDSDKYVTIGAEALIKLNPDMIITSGKPDALIADPRLKSLPAIAKLKVRGVNNEYLTRKGYRVDKELNMVHRAIMDMVGSD